MHEVHSTRLGHVVVNELAYHPTSPDFLKLDALLRDIPLTQGDPDDNQDEIIGKRLWTLLVTIPPAERIHAPLWRELCEVCDLQLSDPKSKTLLLQNHLAYHGVLIDRPIKANLASVSALGHAALVELVRITSSFVNYALLELLEEEPFENADRWPLKAIEVAAGVVAVLDGQLRTYYDVVKAEWTSSHRLLMTNLWQAIVKREGQPAGSDCLQSFIWLDNQHGTKKNNAEKNAEAAIKGSEAKATPADDGMSVIVCSSPFVPSKDSDETAFLQELSSLRSPLALQPMPQLEAIETARETLQSEFPWATSVTNRLFDQLAAKSIVGCRSLFIQPTLLVGEPGAGKSRFVRRLAQVLNIARLDIPLGGEGDVKSLSGTSRGWSSGRPNDMVMAMAERKTATLCVSLDELDKCGSLQGVSVHSFLLGLLEPETASNFRDSYLKVGCNLSTLIWIGTANSLKPIPPALLTRFQIFHLGQPSQADHRTIAEGVIVDTAKDWRVERWLLPSVNDLSIPWDALKSARDVRKAVVDSVTRHTLETKKTKSPSH